MLIREINFINRKRRLKKVILMKYLFLLSERFYGLISWEWKTLKELRRKRRKDFLIRGWFAFFSFISILFLILSPPIIVGILLGEGIKFSIFFIWIWILNLKFFWKCIIYLPRLFKIKNIKNLPYAKNIQTKQVRFVGSQYINNFAMAKYIYFFGKFISKCKCSILYI